MRKIWPLLDLALGVLFTVQLLTGAGGFEGLMQTGMVILVVRSTPREWRE